MTTPQVGDEQQSWASREDYLADLEKQRRELVAQCRLYYAGEQYDADNERCLADWVAEMAGTGEKSIARRLFDQYQLPEHLRRHAYSTQLAESVDWIADRLAEGFAVEASPTSVQQIITDCLNATPEVAAGDDDEDRSVATVLRETGKAGDVPVLVRWDKVEGCCWLEFWDSEMVRMDFRDGRPDHLERVTVEHIDWRPVDGVTKQVTVRREWVLSDQDEGNGTTQSGAGRSRCVERVFIISEGEKIAERPVAVHEWNVDVLPWALVRAQRDNLRATRGSSLITVQAMRTADRYNAVEQVSWLIARYNSHGNMYVIGDTVMVQKENDRQRVNKDVADVLTFPGGTDAGVITLPTDPAMIEHQKSTLIDAMYGRFGLVRTDHETVTNLGQVSGYALEILNEKSEGTFARVRSQLIKDFKALLNLVVDCHQAWSATEPDDDLEPAADATDDNLGTGTGGDTSERKITVRLGSGWIVDEAAARDDFVAGAISRREYLRIKGKGSDEIDDIEDEIAEEEQERQTREQTTVAEAGRFTSFTASGKAGGTVNDAAGGRRNSEPASAGSRA